MKVEKIIFDMDGLIFDSERMFMHELTEVMAEYGYIMTEERYVTTLGTTGNTLRQRMLDMYGEDYPVDEINARTRERVNKLAEAGKLGVKDGIRELLCFLKENDIPCAVASSTPTKYVRQYLAAAGLLDYFAETIGGEKVENSKPEPDIFLKALGTVSPERAFVLEDSANGITAAYRAHIPVICIPDMVYPAENVIKMTAYITDNAANAIEIIKEGI